MIELSDLLKAGVHFGHKSSRWSPRMHSFIWGSKNKIHLINIAKTAFLLEKAAIYLKDLAANGKTVLWIGTKKPAQNIIKNTVTSLKMPFVINRWIGGTLTNFDQVKKAITGYIHMQDVLLKTPSHFKKEISMIQKEIARLEKNIGGIVDLDFPPAAIVLVDAKKERSAIKEALNAKIPVVSLVDTNTNPEGVNYIIPANDDSPRSIKCIIEYISKYIQDGQKIYNEKKKEIEKKKAEAKKPTPLKAKVEKPKTPIVKTQTEKPKAPKAEIKVEKKEEPKKVATPKVMVPVKPVTKESIKKPKTVTKKATPTKTKTVVAKKTAKK